MIYLAKHITSIQYVHTSFFKVYPLLAPVSINQFWTKHRFFILSWCWSKRIKAARNESWNYVVWIHWHGADIWAMTNWACLAVLGPVGKVKTRGSILSMLTVSWTTAPSFPSAFWSLWCRQRAGQWRQTDVPTASGVIFFGIYSGWKIWTSNISKPAF